MLGDWWGEWFLSQSHTTQTVPDSAQTWTGRSHSESGGGGHWEPREWGFQISHEGLVPVRVTGLWGNGPQSHRSHSLTHPWVCPDLYTLVKTADSSAEHELCNVEQGRVQRVGLFHSSRLMKPHGGECSTQERWCLWYWRGTHTGVLMPVPSALSPEPQTSDSPCVTLVRSTLPQLESGVSGCKW